MSAGRREIPLKGTLLTTDESRTTPDGPGLQLGQQPVALPGRNAAHPPPDLAARVEGRSVRSRALSGRRQGAEVVDDVDEGRCLVDSVLDLTRRRSPRYR